MLTETKVKPFQLPNFCLFTRIIFNIKLSAGPRELDFLACCCVPQYNELFSGMINSEQCIEDFWSSADFSVGGGFKVTASDSG